jgi:MoxR-like ATPase
VQEDAQVLSSLLRNAVSRKEAGVNVLLYGPPGTGKTELAKVLADLLDAPLIRLQCYEGLDVAQAAYEWNVARQLLHIRLDSSQISYLQGLFTLLDCLLLQSLT